MRNPNLNIAGKLAKLFVHNRQFGLLVILSLLFWGVLSFWIMPKQYNPEITAPAFNVTVELPGATSQEVYELITRPLENKVKELPKVDKVLSQSRDGGVSIVTVQFYIGEDLEDAKIALSQKLASNMNLKPLGASDPLVEAINPDDVPVVVFALSSETYSPESLRLLAHDLSDRLRRIEGASKIEIKGGQPRQLSVWLDQDQLTALEISPLQVLGAIEQNNLRLVAGNLESSQQDYQVTLDGNLANPKDLENLILRQDNRGAVYLSDVAKISYDTGEKEQFVRFSTPQTGSLGESPESKETERQSPPANTVFLAISKLQGSNVMTVAQNLTNEMQKLEDDFLPPEVSVTTVRNDGQVAQEAIGGLTANLFTAVLIVSLILLLFLGYQSALVVAISIPLTLGVVFGVGNLAGQTINRITLFALILSLGLLVDNATVVVENIYRLLGKNKPPSDNKPLSFRAKSRELSEKTPNSSREQFEPDQQRESTIVQAVNEVGGGLTMSTLTTILAFYPMAFVTSMMGPYMGPIPFFVPAALLASLLIAFTVNPYLLNFLTRHQRRRRNPRKTQGVENRLIAPLRKPFKEISGLFPRLIEKLKRHYRKFLTLLLEKKRWRSGVLLVALVLLLISVSLPALKIVKFRMLPKADKQQFYIYFDLPQYSTLEKTNQLTRQLENNLLSQSEISSIQSFVGTAPVVDFNGLFKGSDARVGSHQATLKINLTHPETRKETSEQLALATRKQLQKFLAQHPGARLKIIEDPPGPPVRSTFLLKVQGENQARLNQITQDLESQVAQIDQVVDIDNSLPEHSLEYLLRIDQEQATLLGVSTKQIATTLRIALSGQAVGLYHRPIVPSSSELESNDLPRQAQQEFIVVRFEKTDRDQRPDLDKIFFTNPQGEKVFLSEVTQEVPASVSQAIFSDELWRTAYISAEMGERSVVYAVIDLLGFLLDYHLPEGRGELTSWSLWDFQYRDTLTGESFRLALDGEWKLTLEVFRDLGLAMAVAIFLIYFVLVAQFKSLTTPLLIMGTIPLALIGVLPGFALLGFWKGIYFNATSMIGVIALSGIVVNNAIIYLEYLSSLLEQKIPLKQAIITAGETRLLPILLTSITTILGSLTIIQDPVWAGLAWAIFWGLSLSAILTLVIFPILFYITKGKKYE